MNRQSIFSSVLALSTAMILVVPCAVWAEGGPYGYGRYAGRPPYHGPYYPHYYPYHYPQYYPNYPCNNCGNHNHNNHNHNYNLWYGLIGGGILGYALGAYQYGNAAEPAYYPPASTAPPPSTGTRYETTTPVGPCLQQREYQTKITVGGKQVQGYGTACLQPDGSWRYGAAQPGSY
jgi:hypothetical protein